jgi:hypothetical protein
MQEIMEKKRRYKLKKGAAENIIRGKSENIQDSKSMNDAEYFDEKDNASLLNASETDENAEEGLGDGKMGRSFRNPEE